MKSALVTSPPPQRHLFCSLLANVTMYEVNVEGYHTPLAATEIAELFYSGRLRLSDQCRQAAGSTWRTIDELFPLLKYDSTRRTTRPWPGDRRSRTNFTLEHSDEIGETRRPITSALKAGWICFGIGLSISWFFPLGNAFFSLAMITAVVAMCTHQVHRGLTLLLTSVAGIVLSTLILFTLVLGVIGSGAMVVAPAIKRAADLQRLDKTAQSLNKPGATNQKILLPDAFQMLPPNIVNPNAASIRQTQENEAMARARASANRRAADEAQRQQNVRNAERQRDQARAKAQQIEQLQKSIDYWDAQVQKFRVEGRDWRWASDQRDAVAKQMTKLQRP